MRYAPVVVCWLAGMATVAGVIGFVAWAWRTIGRATTLPRKDTP